MKRFVLIFGLLILFGFGAIYAGEKAMLNEAAPDFSLTDSNGKKHNLSDYKGKFVILEWINYGCPFVKKHYESKNMQSLQEMYTAKDVVWLAICSSASGKQGYMASNKEINEKNTAMGFKASAYLIDEDGTVGKMYDAKTTPHMYVINKEGVLVYAGAIDSKATARQSDIKTATNYVTEAMDALLVNKPYEAKSTKAYGCSVKYK